MGVMETMVSAISLQKREAMMVSMMPLMMEGIDVNALMPKMMGAMLNEVTAEDVTAYLHRTLQDDETLDAMIDTMLSANPMVAMMMTRHTSRLGFEATVDALMQSLPQHHWKIPDTRDLQALWRSEGVENPPRITVLYLCNPHGGAKIVADAALLPMSVMMPMGLSIYETPDGSVEIAHMNLGMMGGMFTGDARDVLKTSASNLQKALEAVV